MPLPSGKNLECGFARTPEMRSLLPLRFHHAIYALAVFSEWIAHHAQDSRARCSSDIVDRVCFIGRSR